MNKEKIIRSSLFASIGISILSAWMNLMHKPGATGLFYAALALTILFVLTVIPEINNSPKINRSEKIMWIIGLIFLTGITGLIYVFQGRKRVA